jgi:hypothetical protein
MLERQSVQEECQSVFTIDVNCFRGHVSMQPNSSTDPLPCQWPSAPDRRGMPLADSVPFHNVNTVPVNYAIQSSGPDPTVESFLDLEDSTSNPALPMKYKIRL